MADELTPEEKAAKLIDATTKKDKSKIDEIKDSVTGLTDMLKSHVAPKKEDREDEKEVDYSVIGPEEMAKSFAGRTDDAKEFIQKFCDYANISPMDVMDEDGSHYISDEMAKSMREAETDDLNYKFATMTAIKEGNDRLAQRDAVIIHTMLGMMKSFESLVEAVNEKSVSGKGDVDPNIKNTKMPDVGDAAAKDPLSQSDMTKSVELIPDKQAVMRALQKSFIQGSHGNLESQKKFNQYASYFDKYDYDTAMLMVKDDSFDDHQMISGYLLAD